MTQVMTADPTTGILAFADSKDYVLQKIKSRLKFMLGEWFYDTTLGVPWFEQVLIKNPNLQLIQHLISNVIAAVPGITSVTTVEIAFEPSTRTLAIAYAAVYQDAVQVSEVVTSVVPHGT
jgi:hypothetical protein